MWCKNTSFMAGLSHALDGVKEAFQSERSMRIQVVTAVLVIILGILLRLDAWEWIVCTVLIGLVISAELLNTAIEQAVDIFSSQIDTRIKRAKDIAAAAVLIVSLAAAVAGLIIFVPKIWHLIF
jgi:undecaprenol kinase